MIDVFRPPQSDYEQFMTPLMRAASYGHEDVCAALLHAKARPGLIHAEDESKGEPHSALELAAEVGSATIVQMIMDFKCKLLQKRGNKPIEKAIQLAERINTPGHKKCLCVLRRQDTLASASSQSTIRDLPQSPSLRIFDDDDALAKVLSSDGAHAWRVRETLR